PFSNVDGPADSTPSADYVRKQTEPPRFDPDSAAAKEGRARAPDLAPKPLRPKPKAEVGGIVDVDRGADGVMPPSSDSNAASRGPVDDSTPRWPVNDSTARWPTTSAGPPEQQRPKKSLQKPAGPRWPATSSQKPAGPRWPATSAQTPE